MRIKTHLDNTLYFSYLWSDLSCAAELVISRTPASYNDILPCRVIVGVVGSTLHASLCPLRAWTVLEIIFLRSLNTQNIADIAF